MEKQLLLISPTSDQGAIGEDLTRFADDPVGFIKYFEPDIELTKEQIHILESLVDSQEVNVQASHGVGKTWLAAWIVLYFVFAVEGQALTTAPTFRQVKMLLWKYIRSNYDRHKVKLGGRRTTIKVEKTNDAFGEGFSTSNYDENTFQGSHSEKLLIVMDEANGISPAIDDGASSCLTGSDQNKILRIGNPVSNGTSFEVACKAGHIRIPVWSHPNVSWAYEKNTDGYHRLKPDIAQLILREESDPRRRKDPVKAQSRWDESLPRDRIKGAVSVQWIEKIRARKGEGSAYWQGRVEGLFPDVGGQAIVPQRWFLAARARYDINPYYWDDMNRNKPWSFGVDVGDGGDDHCVVGIQGNVVRIIDVIPTLGDRMDVINLAEIVAKKYLNVYGGTAGVDRTGVGSGTLGWLLKNGYNAWGAAFGEAAENKQDEDSKNEDGTFINWKAEAYWGLRDFLAARGNDDISAISPLGEDEEYLMDDLNGTFYEESDRGTRMEDKKKSVARLGRSPNGGDALCIAYAGMAKGEDILWRSAYS